MVSMLPGVFRGLFIGGLAAVIVGFFLARWALGRHAESAIGWASMVENSGIGCLIGASLMFAGSHFGKFRASDCLLARLKFRGDESLLDVGGGHGLLIGAAKLLPQGRAVGIPPWSQVEQSNNSRETTLKNAALEGVAERVSVRDGDMCKLPFADCACDAAVAHFAIHNIPAHEGRRVAQVRYERRENLRTQFLDVASRPYGDRQKNLLTWRDSAPLKPRSIPRECAAARPH